MTSPLLLFLLFLLSLTIPWSSYSHSQDWRDFPYFPSNVLLPWQWMNTRPASGDKLIYVDRVVVRPILAVLDPFPTSQDALGFAFACGFVSFCDDRDSFLFAIAIVDKNIQNSSRLVQVVWSANRHKPVREGAKVELRRDGDLVLTDADGSFVWSTGTSGKSVAGMTLTKRGNLVLYGRENVTIWESFDHPADTLLPGQRLVEGQRLIATASATNWTLGNMYLLLNSDYLVGYIESDRPMPYYIKGGMHMMGEGMNDDRRSPNGSRIQQTYLDFSHGNVCLVLASTKEQMAAVPLTSSAQFMRLDSDGHLRVFQFVRFREWMAVADLMTYTLDYCQYPTVCGAYGVCSNRQCSCPGERDDEDGRSSYFRAVNADDPSQGCSEVTPVACEDTHAHHFLRLENVTYFYKDAPYQGQGDVEKCKAACLSNCSCKAVLFEYHGNMSAGHCTLLSQVLSLIRLPEIHSYETTMFLKVQAPKSSRSKGILGRNYKLSVAIIGSVAGTTSIILLIVVFRRIMVVGNKREAAQRDDSEEYHFHHVSELPTRFSYKDLEHATDNFSEELGSGGSGCVFGGTLADGRKVAVKRMERISQGEKQFLAEVETIGSIHHFSLVRLIGFCIGKSYYLLVYEYMLNGSLDKWIFPKNNNPTLDWRVRHGIILDVAKGLSYLHEGCRQRILHLDIKPQNILLDESFTAKIADFGLSKLVGRDQSKVVTTMRGTLGYIAPEWLNSIITEKVDVYSFGILVLEIICGRKNFDFCQPIEDIYLLRLLKEKARANCLHELVAKDNRDMELNIGEAVKMIRVAMWCLQSDYKLRPAMSKVVKVLEDAKNVDSFIDYDLSLPTTMTGMDSISHPLFGSIL